MEGGWVREGRMGRESRAASVWWTHYDVEIKCDAISVKK
jgi:hypothetical protein